MADEDVGIVRRITSASIGALVTSLIVHPLDVTKTRIQIQSPFKNSFDALYKIAKFEGARNLYTGLSARLYMSVPLAMVYYSTYEGLKRYLMDKTEHSTSRYNRALTTFTPLISGMTGRLFAATTISPLELMRTQMMVQTLCFPK